jgi:membrane-associated phospholipid phosphatase
MTVFWLFILFATIFQRNINVAGAFQFRLSTLPLRGRPPTIPVASFGSKSTRSGSTSRAAVTRIHTAVYCSDDDQQSPHQRRSPRQHPLQTPRRREVIELQILRFLQTNAPTFVARPLALAVHYSLLSEFFTPTLALVAWTVSLPAAASLVSYTCVNDIVNTAFKWAFQRPRPLWIESYKITKLQPQNCGIKQKQNWEADYSFPSAHTQLFSGLAIVSLILAGNKLTATTASLAVLLGTLIGLTRNYLGVHWPTDTAAGVAIGGTLGLVWGTLLDPYIWILRQQSPLLSLQVATGMVAALASGLAVIRRLAPAVDTELEDRWSRNSMAASLSLSETTNDNAENLKPKEDLHPSQFAPRPRKLLLKVPQLATLWCILASTALCPAYLPSAMMEPAVGGSQAYRAIQAVIGLGGLTVWGLGLKKLTSSIAGKVEDSSNKHSNKHSNSNSNSNRHLVALTKGLFYAVISTWIFLGSQITHRQVFAMIFP